MIRANIDEDREATMARFLHGLNRNIADLVELHHYVDMDDMLHMAIKIEKQLKFKSSKGNSTSSSSSWKTNWKNGDKNFNKTKFDYNKGEKEGGSTKAKDKGEIQTKHSRDIQCFKCLGRGHISSNCPNKRTMTMRGNDIFSESDDDECDLEMPELEDASDNEAVQSPSHGELLVTRRIMNVQAKMEDEVQRENIFHTRCKVQDKVCCMIIDGGSCTNVASTMLVEKLHLYTIKHPRPYTL